MQGRIGFKIVNFFLLSFPVFFFKEDYRRLKIDADDHDDQISPVNIDKHDSIQAPHTETSPLLYRQMNVN